MTAPPSRSHRALVESLESRTLLSTGELIRNGSLEGTVSSSDWVRAGQFQADSRFSVVNSGLGYAYLADASGAAANSISGSMYQALTIPASSAEVKLSFWTRISTSETTTTQQNDLLTVRITNSTGQTVLQNVATLSNLNQSNGYVKRTYTLSNSLKGQSVRVLFSASTNASLATVFRVDDIGLSTKAPDLSKKIVGYIPTYRQSLFSQMNLDYVTHVNYFAIKVNNDGSLNASGVNNTNLATVVNAAHAKGVGVSITVGPQSFGTVAASATARTAFATNVVNYALARNLDGIDIDWEPPATGTNYANYALLLQAIFDVSSPHGLKLTAATNPWTQEIPVAATNLMDWVNVMCYDFHYANNSTYEAAIDGMQQWSDYGVEKHKLLMGTPFYGRSGTSWSDTTSKTYGNFFNEYVALHGAPPASTVDQFVDASGKTWYVNGQRTVQKKMAWVRDNGYGGAMIWELGQDHWDGSNKYDRYSLLPVINSMLRPPAWLSPAAGSMFNYIANDLYVDGGRVTFAGNAFASNSNLRLTINTGATAAFNTTQKLAGLTINGTGKLDLKTSDLVVDYGSVSPVGIWTGSAYGGITGQISAGRIFSSSAVGNLKRLGVAESRQARGLSGSQTATWSGHTIDSTAVLVKFTWGGDADLNGQVNIDDYGRIDFNVNASGSIFGWVNGDFDLNGKIDVDDYGIIDSSASAQDQVL